MVIRFFGREFYLPVWLKITIISVISVLLIFFGVIIVKTRSAGEISSYVEASEAATAARASPTASSGSVTSTELPAETPEVALIYVYIVGEISVPDVYEIAEGSILNDLVLLAGGLTESADREAINLASKLSGGMMIKIPAIGDSDKTWLIDSGVSAASSVTTESLATGAKVNINTATAAELCALPGIGESTALKIISYRTEHGKFSAIDEIKNVSGIKDAKYSSIKDYITV